MSWRPGLDLKPTVAPIPMVLYCPAGHQHIDEGEWATKPHKTHQCQTPVRVQCYCDSVNCDGDGGIKPCGLEWRPADFPTVGVESIK